MGLKLTALLAVLTCSCIAKGQNQATEVCIISTIHQAHKVNPNYSYDSLFTFVEAFRPDLIGVEIRQEDLDSSITYLSRNYPFEMYTTLQKFPATIVVGFDWLGDELDGRAIPENFWKEESVVKRLQFQLAADTLFRRELALLDIIQAEKEKLILEASLADLNDGRYDLINRVYYRQLAFLFQNSKYEALSEFYKKRDALIARNIIEIIKKHAGRKMIFLLGAYHRDFTIKKVSESFKGNIILYTFDECDR